MNVITAADLLSQPIVDLERMASTLRGKPGLIADSGLPIKLAVLSSFTNDYLVDMLRLMFAHRGFSPQIVACGYGQMIQELLVGGPAMGSSPDVVLVLPTHRDLRHAPDLGATVAQAGEAVENEAVFWRDLIGRIAAPKILLTFDTPVYREQGEADGLLPGGLGRHARRVNAMLADMLDPSVSLVDAEALQIRLGGNRADARLYALCKQPFSMEALPEIADTLAAAAAARLARARKVLVLDLDNTVWGGVVGDLGIGALTLGNETPEGEAFVSFQRYAKALGRRGVMLAVCSKNDDEVARSAFRDHPAMVLKHDDIACFVANFEDKASNLRLIAQRLNVGLDALVFVDDSPVERAWVRQQLPEIWTIELPEDPALYAQAIEAVKPFPVHRLTKEDMARTASYQALAQTRAQFESVTDVDSFLKDLSPVGVIEAIDRTSIDRVVQLIGKTNQFKLNPTTFTVNDVMTRAADVIALRLTDRLQDYGIVAVAVTERRAERLDVLNWVMSCRVFSRRVEHAMRELLAAHARAAGATVIRVNYVASKKNGLVPDALTAIGFRDCGSGLFEMAAVPASTPHYVALQDHRAPIAVDAPQNERV